MGDNEEYRRNLNLVATIFLVAWIGAILVGLWLAFSARKATEADIVATKDSMSVSDMQSEAQQSNQEIQYDAYTTLSNDINRLKSKDKDTITKYFGTLPKEIIDNEYVFNDISIKCDKVEDNQLYLRVITQDYDKLMKDTNEAREEIKQANVYASEDNVEQFVQKSIRDKVQSGAYKYETTVVIPDSTVDNEYITEDLKSAISGKIYKSVYSNITTVTKEDTENTETEAEQ